jgi:hypothetical protein
MGESTHRAASTQDRVFCRWRVSPVAVVWKATGDTEMEELIAYYPWLSLEVDAPAPAAPSAAKSASQSQASSALPFGAPRMMGDYRPRERAIRLRERRSSRRESGYSLRVHLYAA